MLSLWRDARFALRMMAKNPGATAVIVLTLAIGIGATTVMFSVVDAILLEPYTYKDPARITHFLIHDESRPHDWGRGGLSVPEFMDYEEQNHVFEQISGFVPMDILYTENGTTEQLAGCWVTGNTFEVHGVAPLLGRPITPRDAQPDAPPVAVMSYRLWSKRFNRDPSIVGKVFTFNGTPTTLIGIMPPRFVIDNRDIWIPISLSHGGVINSQTGLPMYLIPRARLKKTESIKSAAADLDVIAQRLSKIYPKDYPQQFNVMTMTITDWTVGDLKKTLYVLMAAVAMLLLIACSNVANLLLARSTAREREIAIRATLGAGQGSLVRQLLVESLVLSLMASVLGTVFAYVGLKAVVAALPVGGVPPNSVFRLDARALLFSLGIGLLTTLLCGLAPALHAVRGALYGRLAGSGKGSGGGHRHGKLRGALVITEVALSIILLIGCGLMTRTLLALVNMDTGFNPNNVLVARVAIPKGRYDTAQRKGLFFRDVLRRVSVLPGVISTTETTSLPPYSGIISEVTVPGKTHLERWNASLELCSEGYFQTLGLHLRSGRVLSEADVESARHVAVINERFARNYLGGEDPVGRTVKFNFLDQAVDAPHDAYFEIVGVIGDFKNQGLQEIPLPEAFVPYTVTSASNRAIFVKTTGDPMALLETVRREVWAVDPDAALTNPGSIESYLQDYTYAGPRFGLITISAFAGMGLLLVVMGIFGVISYTVSLQTHEIGIRMALGAQQSDVLRMVLKNGLVLISAGVLLGLAGSLALSRLIVSEVWGISTTDPLTFAVVVAAVFLAGLAACFAPARKATSVDPLIALRYE